MSGPGAAARRRIGAAARRRWASGPLPLADRFARYAPADGPGCWLWSGGLTSDGYGQLSVGRGVAPMLAHRVAWTRAYGPVPPGLAVIHRCDLRACVRPAHLALSPVRRGP